MGSEALHILVLTDREWSHPEAGGTGTTLQGLVSRWTAAGNNVTIIASAYPGAVPIEHPHSRLEIHRMGNRLTVFPNAASAFRHGIGRNADVVFELVNGIAFFTALWPSLRVPTVAMVQHVHQEHYVMEAGWRGYIGRLLLERVPLRYLYGRARICTISNASRRDLVALGVREQAIHVTYLGVDPPSLDGGRGRSPPLAARKAERPTLLYLGRLKRYKRLELLLDVLTVCPDAVLEVAGDGTHRAAFEAEVQRRQLDARVVMHGFVDEAAKAELYTRAWVNVTASAAEGWGHTVMEAATYSTPSAALSVGGLVESIVDGETGVLANDAAALSIKVRQILGSPALRDRLGSAAADRARGFSWDRTAEEMLAVLTAAAAPAKPAARARPTFRFLPARLSLRRGVPNGAVGSDPVDGDAVAGGQPRDTTTGRVAG